MASYPDKDLGQERKNGLTMEKKNRGYFSDSNSYATHLVNTQPEPTAPSPSADKNAKNPNALRYWNQCIDKTTLSQNNAHAQRLNVESPNSPQNSRLSWNALDSTTLFSTPDSLNSKFVTKTNPFANQLQVEVPHINNRERSEYVPRTIKTLKVTATVTQSPVLNRKIVKPDVESGKVLCSSERLTSAPIIHNVKENGTENFRRGFISPLPFQTKISETSNAEKSPNLVWNSEINKPEVLGAKLLNASENVIKKEGALTKKYLGEFDKPGNFKRNLMSPLPFQSRLSEASRPYITQGPTLNENVNKPEVDGLKLSNTSVNGNKKETDTNIYYASNNMKEYDKTDKFMSPIPIQSHPSEASTPFITPIPAYDSTGNLRTNFTSPIPFQSHHYDASTPCITPVPALNGKINKQVVDGAKLPTIPENTSFVENNVKEYRPENLRRNFILPQQLQSHPSEANIPRITPVPAHDKIGHLRTNFMSPIPFLGHHSNQSTPCITLVPALNGELNKQEVDGAKLPTTYDNGIKKEGVKNTYFVENNVIKYKPVQFQRPHSNDRTGKLRTNFMSPIPFQRPHSDESTPYVSPVPALDGKVNKQVAEGAKLPTISENGIEKEAVKNNSFVENNGNEFRPENLRRNFISPQPLQSHPSEASTPSSTPVPAYEKIGNLRMNFMSPIPFQIHPSDASSPVPALNGEVNETKLSTTSENGTKKEIATNTTFIKDNWKEFRLVNLMSPGELQCPILKTNSASITPVPVLLDNENKEEVVGAKPKPEAINLSVTPVSALNREAIKVEGDTILSTGYEKAKFSNNSCEENSVQEYERPENFRKGCLSPIACKSNLSNANVTSMTASPALNQKVSKSENEGLELLGTSENGIKRQPDLPISVEVVKPKELDTSVTLRNLNAPITFPGQITASTFLKPKLNNQEVDSVIDTLPTLEDIIEKISPVKKSELGLKLFYYLPENVVDVIVAQKLSTMPSKQLGSMLNRLPEESVNKLIPNLFLKASDDVKLSLILDCLPKLSVQKILKDLNDSEKETRKESLRKMTKSLMAHRQM